MMRSGAMLLVAIGWLLAACQAPAPAQAGAGAAPGAQRPAPATPSSGGM